MLSSICRKIRAVIPPRWCRWWTEKTHARWIELFFDAHNCRGISTRKSRPRVLVTLNEHHAIAPFRRKTSTKERLSRYYYSQDNDSDVRIVLGIACLACCELNPRARHFWHFFVDVSTFFSLSRVLLFFAPIDKIASRIITTTKTFDGGV